MAKKNQEAPSTGASDNKRSYRVLRVNLRINGVRYAPGAVVKLTSAEVQEGRRKEYLEPVITDAEESKLETGKTDGDEGLSEGGSEAPPESIDQGK